jgi:hypothetical protein
MSADDPADVQYDIWGNPLPPPNPVLERIAQLLEDFTVYRMDLDKRIQLLSGDGTNIAQVRGGYTVASPLDPSLVIQASPNQMPIAVQSAPQGASVYQYYGYTPAATTLQFVGVPQQEIFANTTAPSIKSTSTLDAAGGTGMRKVLIQYFDQQLRGPYFVVVALNGVTAVNLAALLPAPLCYVEALYGLEFGSTFANQGNIQIFSAAGGTGTSIGQINPGDNKTAWNRHYIPAGVTSYITGYSLVLQTAGIVNGFIGSTPNFNSGQLGASNIGAETNVTGYMGGNQGFNYSFPTPLPVVGPGRFYLQAITNVATSNVWGTMSFYDLPTAALPGLTNPPIPGNPRIPLPYTLVTP